MKRALVAILSLILVLSIILPASAISTVAVKGIKLNSAKVTLNVGKTYALKAALTPANTTQKSLTYASANSKIATVDKNGIIKAVAAGTTTITVYTFNKKIYAKCSVTVSQAVNKFAKEVDISYAGWTISDATADQQKASYDKIFKNLLAKTNIKVDYQQLPANDFRTWLMTQQAAGNDPEVYQSRLAWAFEDYNKGFVIDLGPNLNKENPFIPGQKWFDTINPVLMSQSIMPGSNKYVAVPNMFIQIRILYNKDIFSRLGIKAPLNTWTDFLAACKKIKDAGITPFAFANSKTADCHFSWFLTCFIGMLDEQLRNQMDYDKNTRISTNELAMATDKGMIDFTKAPFKHALEMMKDFSAYVNPDLNSTDQQIAKEMFARGSTAMTMIGSWDLKAFTEMDGRKADFGIMPIPIITKGEDPNANGKRAMVSGKANESIAISTRAKGDKLAAAVETMQYLLSPDAMGILQNDMWLLSTLKDAKVTSNLSGFGIQPEEDYNRANYTGPATSPAFADFLVLSGQLYLTGKTDFNQFASELNKEWQKDMDAAKKANNWTAENEYGMKQ